MKLLHPGQAFSPAKVSFPFRREREILLFSLPFCEMVGEKRLVDEGSSAPPWGPLRLREILYHQG
jgi:hypothetical protein